MAKKSADADIDGKGESRERMRAKVRREANFVEDDRRGLHPAGVGNSRCRQDDNRVQAERPRVVILRLEIRRLSFGVIDVGAAGPGGN